MRDMTRFFIRFYWDEAFDTLIGSAVVVLVSLFFANFDSILPLYDPVILDTPNSHVGFMGLFQIILLPSLLSTAVSLVTGTIKGFIKLRRMLAKSGKRAQNEEMSSE